LREVLPQLLAWWESGATVGMATVVGTSESAPSLPGATMLVGPDGTAVGSVSGGCVESDVYALAQEVIAGRGPVRQRYGVPDADSAAVGLPCGGILDVFVQPVSRELCPELGLVFQDVAAGRPVAVASVVAHPDPDRLGRFLVVRAGRAATGSLGSENTDTVVGQDVARLLAAGTTQLLSYGPNGERGADELQVFAACYPPPPRLLVCGSTEVAVALARVGGFLGYRVTVCDARPVFTTAARFPAVDEVVVDWPHRYLAGEAAAHRIDSRTVLCVLTHDEKFDLPLLEVALRLPELGYVGLIGSRRTGAERLQQLRERGVTETELARLSSPTGLDLGGRTPAETALSIAAEIVCLREGGRGQRLSELDGRIH